jgi:hypothetical protein
MVEHEMAKHYSRNVQQFAVYGIDIQMEMGYTFFRR